MLSGSTTVLHQCRVDGIPDRSCNRRRGVLCNSIEASEARLNTPRRQSFNQDSGQLNCSLYCIKYCRGQEMLLMSSNLTRTTCHVQVNLLPRQPNGDNLLSSSSMHIDRSCFTQYAVLFIAEPSMTHVECHACRRVRTWVFTGTGRSKPN